MYYECLGNNQYEITMELFRDCNSSGAVFDSPATFGIFDSNDNFVFQVQDFPSTPETIEPDLSSPCLSIPPDICVESAQYVFTVTLPDNLQEYQVVYQRCCRNQTILNLDNPGAQGLTIVAEIPPADVGACNNKPFFNNFPPPVLCAQEELIFDHSATDLDGDSLAYKLCSPFQGGTQTNPAPIPPSNPPYNEVVWGDAFDEISPLNADPGLEIDVNTGLLTGTPIQLGQFVVGVCVEEWRDGELLSVNTRDFQFNVAFCEPTSEAIIAEPSNEDLCQDLTFDFENLSDPVNQFVWDFGDPTTEDDVATTFNASYTYPDTGTYTVTLISNPGFFCSDTSSIEIPVYFNAQIEVSIADFECIGGTQVFSFAADGEFDQENGTVLWDFGENANPSEGEGLQVDGITFSEVGPQSVQVQVLNSFCTADDEVEIMIPEPPEATIDPQNEFCNGLTYLFTHQSENASFYNWDFGVVGDDTDVSNQQQASFTFPEEGIYTVSLTVQGIDNCPLTVTEQFDIRALLAPEIEPTSTVCLENNSVDFQAAGSYTANASFAWEFEMGSPGSSNQENPQGISFESSGQHALSLEVSENGCTRTAEAIQEVHLNPIAAFEAFPTEGCVPLEVIFSEQSISESSSISYSWDLGDGNTSTSKNVRHVYDTPGEYSVSLSLENLNGCIDSDQVTIENLINASPAPTAGFLLDPQTVSVINPEISNVNNSEGSTSCTYFFDNQLFEQCSFEHILNNIEPQTITQTVVNEFGCIDRTTRDIFISDHLIYIPNAFSPDGDGLNDIFKPVTTGAVQIQMYIYDRWGHLVYQNNNEEIGWNGQSPNEDYFAPSGVYQYQIIITDNQSWNHEYTGSVRLLR